MTWLNQEKHFQPGAELFASDRTFELFDYTPSHSQLLLRSVARHENVTRIDILFKPVVAQKLRGWYDGLRIRCATQQEQQRIQTETPNVKYRHDDVFFVLDEVDYVVAMAVGWHEGANLGNEVSYFADPHNNPPWRRKALDGVSGDIGSPMSTVEEFTAVLRDPQDRDRYRDVYIVLMNGRPVAGFLVREEAEQRRQQLAANCSPDFTYTVNAVSIAF